MAKYMREGESCFLEMTFPLTVSDPLKEGELQESGDEDEDELEDDDDDYPDATGVMSASAVAVSTQVPGQDVVQAEVSPQRTWKTTEGSGDESDVQDGGDASEDIGDEDEDEEEEEASLSRRLSGGRKLLANVIERNDSKRRKQV